MAKTRKNVGKSPESPAAYLAKIEPRLRRVIDHVGEVAEHPGGDSAFLALAKAIVHQQLNGKAAATIWERVVAAAGGALTPERAAELPVEALRAAGLSRSKTAAFKDLAEKVLAGAVPEHAELATMEDEAVIEALTGVRGIGRWTAEMYLIFTLRRPDVFPASDFGVRKGYALISGTPDAMLPPKELSAVAEAWKPHRSAAAWFLWRATEMPELRELERRAKVEKQAKVAKKAPKKKIAKKTVAKKKKAPKKKAVRKS